MLRPIRERWGIVPMRHVCRVVRFLGSTLLFVAAGCAAEVPYAPDQADERPDDGRHELLLAEIEKLGNHEWAGDYYSGDGLGVNISLVISPKEYLFEWHGCLGVYDRNYGAVTEGDGQIHLSFTFENKRQGFRGIAPDFIPVSWGPRRYLIPADDIVGFCNCVNDGQEPRSRIHGLYLLRRGDESKDVVGLPNVPDEFRSYLLTVPIEATIVAVDAFTTRPSVADWKFKDTPVTLDAGSNKGLHRGMEFVVTEPERSVVTVRITKVHADRSEGVVTQIGEDRPGPAVGWRLSTQAPWNRKQNAQDAEIK